MAINAYRHHLAIKDHLSKDCRFTLGGPFNVQNLKEDLIALNDNFTRTERGPQEIVLLFLNLG